jgi:hypothetical protein
MNRAGGPCSGFARLPAWNRETILEMWNVPVCQWVRPVSLKEVRRCDR